MRTSEQSLRSRLLSMFVMFMLITAVLLNGAVSVIVRAAPISDDDTTSEPSGESAPALPAVTEDTLLSKMYVASASNNRVVQANLDGTAGVSLGNLGGTLNLSHGIALDLVNDKMYVTNYGNHTVSQANLDGTGGASFGNLGGTIFRPYGIDLDLVNGKMYVTNITNNTIAQANLDGTGGGNLGNLGGLLNRPHGIAVDPAGGKLYIANYGTNSIVQANLDGTSPVDLGSFNNNLNGPDGITLDLINNWIYITNNANSTAARGNLDGTGGISLGNLNGTLNGPAEIALDLYSGKMYVANNNNNTISQANLDGTGGVSLGNLGGNLNWPNGMALDLNTPPTATDDTFGVQEDSVDNPLDVLHGDSDPDGDPLLISSVGTPDQSGIAINGGTVITYTPATDFFGTEVFTYTLSDTYGGFDTATITVTVSNLNDAPVADDDAFAVQEDSMDNPLNVLDGDTDVDGDTLSVSDIGTPDQSGTAVNGTTVITYTPAVDFYGTEVFTYTVTDGNGGFDTAAITVTVSAVPDAPAAVDDAYAVDEDDVLAVPPDGVLDNDWDADGDPITATLETAPTNGSLDFNVDGSFVYTPTLNFNGTDLFSYIASDGILTDTAVVTITVNSINDNPIVNAGDNLSGDEGFPLEFQGSFTDPGFAALNSTVLWDFGDGITVTGTLTPTHAYGDNGVYTVTLTVEDEQGGVGQDYLLASVYNVDPALPSLPDQSINYRDVMTLTTTITDPSWLDSHTVTIAWGDGITDTINLPAGNMDIAAPHLFAETGQYTVTVTVDDDDGGQAIETFMVEAYSTMRIHYMPIVRHILQHN